MPAVVMSYPLVPDLDAWIVPEGKVSEAPPHDVVARRVDAVVRARAARIGLSGSVHRNLALHWRPERPRTGVDPDVTLVVPPIEGWREAPRSLRLWLPEIPRPRLAIEVVSTTHPNKDYTRLHERYADLRIPELWVLDPLLHGPRAFGGPVPLQQWLTTDHGFERVCFGAEPFHSPTLGIWVRPLDEPPGVAFSLDAAGRDPVLDAEQELATELVTERQRADAEHQRADAERHRAEALAAELAELRRDR